jgi:hypothetical protein
MPFGIEQQVRVNLYGKRGCYESDDCCGSYVVISIGSLRVVLIPEKF